VNYEPGGSPSPRLFKHNQLSKGDREYVGPGEICKAKPRAVPATGPENPVSDVPSYFIPGIRMVGLGYVMNAPLTTPIAANITMAATMTTAV
jgi:hypothetical protein